MACHQTSTKRQLAPTQPTSTAAADLALDDHGMLHYQPALLQHLRKGRGACSCSCVGGKPGATSRQQPSSRTSNPNKRHCQTQRSCLHPSHPSHPTDLDHIEKVAVFGAQRGGQVALQRAPAPRRANQTQCLALRPVRGEVSRSEQLQHALWPAMQPCSSANKGTSTDPSQPTAQPLRRTWLSEMAKRVSWESCSPTAASCRWLGGVQAKHPSCGLQSWAGTATGEPVSPSWSEPPALCCKQVHRLVACAQAAQLSSSPSHSSPALPTCLQLLAGGEHHARRLGCLWALQLSVPTDAHATPVFATAAAAETSGRQTCSTADGRGGSTSTFKA